MADRNFRTLLEQQWEQGRFVCVGLDSDYAKIPDAVKQSYESPSEAMLAFNEAIIGATHDLVCAYKPNIAFYEERGAGGLLVLRDTIRHIHEVAQHIPVILDAKRGDIGNTNRGYVHMAFEYLNADAITVHPYLGQEALQPFLEMKNKGIIVLCVTSNKGAAEFQGRPIKPSLEEGKHWGIAWDSSDRSGGPYWEIKQIPFYELVAYRVTYEWNKNNNCAVVVGATYPKELARVRKIVGDMPILIPGIGTQGGDTEQTVRAGKDSKGHGMIINSSSGIIFASQGDDYAQAARQKTLELHTLINQYR